MACVHVCLSAVRYIHCCFNSSLILYLNMIISHSPPSGVHVTEHHTVHLQLQNNLNDPLFYCKYFWFFAYMSQLLYWFVMSVGTAAGSQNLA